MPLNVGSALGHYEVTGLLGKGGMGEVYRARDTKLDREVALKVLPEAFTSDPECLARFEREAKVLASLNHMNIGGIHGLEEAEPAAGSDQGPTRALVLELVDKPTLALPLSSEFSERNAALLPDGRWLAYNSDESGQREVYVRPFSDIDAGRW